MTDYSQRYKTEKLDDWYVVIEEASGTVSDLGPYTYDEAQKVADRRNDELAIRRATA